MRALMLFSGLVLLGSLSRASALEPETGVRLLYAELDRSLEGFKAGLPAPSRRPMTFATELLAANSHRQEALLQPRVLEGVRFYLEALRKMGVGGVKVTASYPVIAEDNPRLADYLVFYKAVAEEVRKRGMKLLVATGVLIPDETTGVKPHEKIGFERYKKARTFAARTCAKELAPDYLTIANEPSTEAWASGVAELKEPDKQEELVRHILDGLKDLRKETRVGAGSGNWDDPAFVRFLASRADIDYIDLHFYPVQPRFSERALELARIAREHKKPLIVGEAWLYKAAHTELNSIAACGPIFARDVYSFWEPLDKKYIEVLARFADAEGIEFVSFFWGSKYFFATLDVKEVPKGQTPAQLLQLADQAVVRAILKGELSGTGEFYRDLIRGRQANGLSEDRSAAKTLEK